MIDHRSALIRLTSDLPLFISVYRKYKLYRKNCKFPNETPLPGVSILKPLMGIDKNLAYNLETFFSMDYPLVSNNNILLFIQ